MKPPAELDGTTTDVSYLLADWIDTLPMGTASNPTVIELGQHRVLHGLKIVGKPWLHLYGGQLIQDDPSVADQYGVQILKPVECNNFLVCGTRIQGAHVGGYSVAYEDWPGVKVVACDQATITQCEIHDVGGDFVYASSKAGPIHTKSLAVIGNVMEHCGRQGFVPNSADGCLFSGNTISSVGRYIVDIEPLARDVVRDLNIVRNTCPAGGLGFLHFAAPWRTQVGKWNILSNNIVKGQPKIWLETTTVQNLDGTRSPVIHDNLAINDNFSTDPTVPYAGSLAMWRLGGWDHVEVVDNRAYLKVGREAVKLIQCGEHVATGPNDWIYV